MAFVKDSANQRYKVYKIIGKIVAAKTIRDKITKFIGKKFAKQTVKKIAMHKEKATYMGIHRNFSRRQTFLGGKISIWGEQNYIFAYS